MTLEELKEQARKNREDGKADDDVGMVVVGRSCAGLPIRPKVLSYNRDGTKVYMVTVGQLKRLLEDYE